MNFFNLMELIQKFMGQVGNLMGHVGNFMGHVGNFMGQTGNPIGQDGTSFSLCDIIVQGSWTFVQCLFLCILDNNPLIFIAGNCLHHFFNYTILKIVTIFVCSKFIVIF